MRPLAPALLLLATLSGCAVDPYSAAVAAAPVTTAGPASVVAPTGYDVGFAAGMIAHHAQAVWMSRSLLAKQGVGERVAAIAEFIEKDQKREIEEMNAWLAAWGQQKVIPDAMPVARHHNGHGMLTRAQLGRLTAADGPTGTTLFLAQMIEHHQGAIAMSQSVLKVGKNAYIRTLAKHIINEQGAEITAMTNLLPPVGD